MSLTVTHQATDGESSTATATKTTASFTPSANSKLYIATGAVDGTFDFSISANTGGLTFTRKAQSTETVSFGQRIAIFEAPVGGSPSAMTATIDCGEIGYISYSVFDVTATSGTPEIKTGQFGTLAETEAFGDTETLTVTLPSAATTGNAVIAAFASNSDAGGAPSAPSTFSTLGTAAETIENAGSFYSTAFTGTTVTCPDLGQGVGSSSGVVVEIEEVGGGPPPDLMFLNITRSGMRVG